MKLIKWFFKKLVFPTGSLIELKILVQEPFQGLYSYKTSKLHRKHHKCSGLVQQRDQGKIERRKDEVVNCQISEIYVLSLLRCKVRVPQKTRKALRLYFFFLQDDGACILRDADRTTAFTRGSPGFWLYRFYISSTDSALFVCCCFPFSIDRHVYQSLSDIE